MEKVVGIGEILWDVFPDGSVLGGAPCNFAMHVNSLGLDGYVVSSIGCDDLGEQVKTVFRDRNLKALLNESDKPTGTVVVTLDSQGKASYDFTKNSAWDYLELTPESINLAKEASCVCFGSLGQRGEVSRKSIYRFLELTNRDCIKIFDINIRGNYYSKELIESSLNYATVLKLNDEEFPLLQEMFKLPDGRDNSLNELIKMFNLELVILTMGGDGSLLYRSPKDNSFFKPDKIDIVDTVGAGDSFTAAVAVGLLKKKTLIEINIMANKIASYVCTQKGGTPLLDDIFPL